MPPQQYFKLNKFSEIGVNGKWYIDKSNGTFTVYMYRCTCMRLFERVAEESMQKAVEEMKAQPDYSSTGEVMYMYMYIQYASKKVNIPLKLIAVYMRVMCAFPATV